MGRIFGGRPDVCGQSSGSWSDGSGVRDFVFRFGESAVIKRLRCLFERAWLRTIRRVFRFDEWHANAPYACRPYKKSVVDLANSLRPNTVVEVGCGLGEILS